MTQERDDLSYKGPNKEYKPQDGTNASQVQDFFNTFDDQIYQYEFLENQIQRVITETDAILSQADYKLKNFALKIRNNKVMEAQKAIWPSSMPDVKDYVTYEQYSALEPRLDRSSKIIKDEYTKNLRGEQGSGALDVRKLAKVINTEAKNIKGFLDEDIISDVNDSAQKRIAELFQDWSSSALTHTQRLSSFFSERDQKDTSKIPESEMATLTEEDASRYQALFKARINALNLEIDRQVSDFEKYFLVSSDIFYSKFLGPAIRFHKKAGSDLMFKADESSILGREIIKAGESLNLNMHAALTDLLQRNEIFESIISSAEANIGRQESLRQVFEQFSQKSGKTVDPFLTTVPDEETNLSLKKSLEEFATQQNYSTSMISTHNTLANREDPLAHPQYILKSGDKITGDIQVGQGVKIDGVIISEHQHTGFDGSAQIGGGSIVPGSLPVSAVDVSQTVEPPKNLRLVGYSDGGTIGEATILNANFFWESQDPDQIYEIQITKRDGIGFDE